MKVKWEKNSRVVDLANRGKINDEDIIPRTTTDNFPPETATVRMHNLSEKVPHVMVHIRGKSRQRQGWNGLAYECAATCRVSIVTNNKWSNGMSSSGDLDFDLNWLDVHNVVEEVKNVMGIN